MPFIHLQLVQFIGAFQPGFVAGVFTDANGTQHTIIDKVPVVALSELRAESTYPQDGAAARELIEQSFDAEKRSIVRISISKPWGLESTDGATEFIVFQSQIEDDIASWR